MIKFEVTGGREMSAALQLLGAEATAAGRRALRQAARSLQADLVAAAPRRKPLANGRTAPSVLRAGYQPLWRSIRVRMVRPKKEGVLMASVSTGKAFWGYFLEFGTRNMPARPWFRPVVDSRGPGLVSQITDNLRRQIDLAARRIERRSKAR